jgi:hypothetical protein
MMSPFRCVLYVSGLVLVLGLRPVVRHPLTIRFRNCAGKRPLQLSGELYSNSFGESFSVQQFKYYISAIRVSGEGVGEEVLKEAHLVDEGDSSSLVLHLST